ncbi:MAG: von Willebrand factor type [Clostridia bacterium]|jgi:Ca-activated chloride channel family protein|nr:von Willebrand factor type [Clostridia bacterium]
MGSRRFSVLAVLFSLFGGGITLLLGEVIFSLRGSLPEYAMMGLYFGIGALVLAVMMMVAGSMSPELIGVRWKTHYFKTSLKLLIPSTVIMVGLSACLLQLIYGAQIGKGKQIQDIIIAVDTSGSMNDTDPNGERFIALKELIDEIEGDKRVSLVTFDEEPHTVFDFTALDEPINIESMKEAIDQIVNSEEGLTEIRRMVEYAYESIEQRTDKSRGSSLIIVSDGEPTDGSDQNIPLLIQKYTEANIPVYTIGMMHQTSETEEYLEAISNQTGGKHFSVSRTSMLKKTFERIRYSQESRNLLGERAGYVKHSAVYSWLRVILLTLLGGLIALGQGFVFDNRFLAKGLIIGGMLGAFLGGLGAEMLLKNEVNPLLARCLFLFVLTLFLPLFTWVIEFKDGYHGPHRV